MVIPMMYKPAPTARVGEDDTISIMEAVGEVKDGPAELTTQRESSVFVELRTVLNRDMAVAAPGSISCSEIKRRFYELLDSTAQSHRGDDRGIWRETEDAITSNCRRLESTPTQ